VIANIMNIKRNCDNISGFNIYYLILNIERNLATDYTDFTEIK
jgi:hypothetical protein